MNMLADRLERIANQYELIITLSRYRLSFFVTVVSMRNPDKTMTLTGMDVPGLLVSIQEWAKHR